MLKDIICSPEEAAKLVKDGDTLTYNGLGMCANGGWFSMFLEKEFLATGHPNNLTLFNPSGIGTLRVPNYDYAKFFAHEGMLGKLVLGHMANYRPLFGLINDNKVPTYNISQGTMSILLSEMSAGKNGYYTKVGLHTTQDPRLGGGAMNEAAAKDPMVFLSEQDGEECLYVKGIPIDVAIVQASYADEYGNISMEEEVLTADALTVALAAKQNGGKVIAIVHHTRKGQTNAQLVQIPGYLVDAVVLHTEYYQCLPGIPFNKCLSGEETCSEEEAYAALEQALNNEGKRKAADFHIARRAALEVERGNICNLGIGIPQMVATEGRKMGTIDSTVNMTLETGVCGGVPVASPFGAAMNSLCIYDQASQFRFYEGGGLDVGFLGALEIDRHGNVNVSAKGPLISGVGGFNYITHGSKKLVFCSKFLNSASFKMVDGKLVKIPGAVSKIVDEVEAISFNAEDGYRHGKKVVYVTERCVFELGPNGIILTEIAPGFDLEKDILAYLDFELEISPDLKAMPAVCFEVEGF